MTTPPNPNKPVCPKCKISTYVHKRIRDCRCGACGLVFQPKPESEANTCATNPITKQSVEISQGADSLQNPVASNAPADVRSVEQGAEPDIFEDLATARPPGDIAATAAASPDTTTPVPPSPDQAEGTPETDAQIGGYLNGHAVLADFARSLERRLREACAQRDGAQEEAVRLDKGYSIACDERTKQRHEITSLRAQLAEVERERDGLFAAAAATLTENRYKLEAQSQRDSAREELQSHKAALAEWFEITELVQCDPEAFGGSPGQHRAQVLMDCVSALRQRVTELEADKARLIVKAENAYHALRHMNALGYANDLWSAIEAARTPGGSAEA